MSLLVSEGPKPRADSPGMPAGEGTLASCLQAGGWIPAQCPSQREAQAGAGSEPREVSNVSLFSDPLPQRGAEDGGVSWFPGARIILYNRSPGMSVPTTTRVYLVQEKQLTGAV